MVLHVRLSLKLAQRVTRAAEVDGVKPSEAARMALVDYCNRAEETAARRRRWIEESPGIRFADIPDDLPGDGDD